MKSLEDLRPSDTQASGESHMPTATRPRPRTLFSSTTKLNTEEGKLYSFADLIDVDLMNRNASSPPVGDSVMPSLEEANTNG